MSQTDLNFMDHLMELRHRLFKCFLAIGISSIIGLFFSKDLYLLLQIPMLKALPQGSYFIATGPFESYITFFKIALVFGLFLASPIIFYQIWRFIKPALRDEEKKMMIPFSITSALLFTGGALFGYFVVFPTGFYYVNLLLEGTAIEMVPKMNEYLSVALTLLIAFGVSFELPLFIFILGKLGLINYQKISEYRRYVIVGLFILAAILTPGPDVLSQCLMAAPLWVLYECGGLSLKLIKKSE